MIIEATKINDIFKIKRCVYCRDKHHDENIVRLIGRWDENKNIIKPVASGTVIKYINDDKLTYYYQVIQDESSPKIGENIFMLLSELVITEGDEVVNPTFISTDKG